MFSALDRVSQLEEDVRLLRAAPARAARRSVELIERCLAHRRAQLAIERLGVPFEACVVLVEPRHELRPYFNGRHARTLPRREGSEVTELRGDSRSRRRPWRRRCGLRPGIPSRRRAAGVLRRRARPCPRLARGATQDFRDYLAREGRVAWEDEWVAVHELEPLAADGGRGGAREVRRASLRDAAGNLARGAPRGLLRGAGGRRAAARPCGHRSRAGWSATTVSPPRSSSSTPGRSSGGPR